MLPSRRHEEVLSELVGSWPQELKLELQEPSCGISCSHPLACELEAFAAGKACSLPEFSSSADTIVWRTMGADYKQLNEKIADLSAWIIPSLGWESPGSAIVSAVSACGLAEKNMAELSPSGLYKWLTRIGDFDKIVAALVEMRALENKKPQHCALHAPSLFELRLDFKLALAACDRDEAESIIHAIKSSQQDTSLNICFMRIFLWDQFHEYRKITSDDDLRHIVNGRMPGKIRDAIIRAFYYVEVEEFEAKGTLSQAAEAYKKIDDFIGGLFEYCEHYGSVEVRRMAAYRQQLFPDEKQARLLLESDSADKVLGKIIGIVPLGKACPQLSPEEMFWEARKKENWKKLQNIGLEILDRSPQEYGPILRKSLEFRRCDPLSEKLAAISAQVPAVAEKIIPLPRSWADVLSLIKTEDWRAGERFLKERPDPLELSSDSDLSKLICGVEEVLSDNDFEGDEKMTRRLKCVFEQLIEDFLREPMFPRDSLSGLYYAIFMLMDRLFRGTPKEYIWQIFLELGKAVLASDSNKESEVLSFVKAWWEARKSPALLPVVLEAIESLYEISTEKNAFEDLWLGAIELVRREVKNLTRTDIELWREIGLRIGFGEGDVDDALPKKEAQQAEADAFAGTSLKTIAIVSLREKQAREAQKIISGKVTAEVFCVSEKVAGASTKKASSADVVLFVWSAVKHAVFRAFDDIDREKIAYVPGTGSASIVRTLERWILKNKKNEPDAA